MTKFLKPHIECPGILNPKVGDPSGYVSSDGTWAAVPWAGNTKGFCIINDGKQVHHVKTYKQALDFIRKASKIKSKGSLKQFLQNK